MLKLAILVGSLRKESINKKLALNLMELGKDKFDAKIGINRNAIHGGVLGDGRAELPST